MDEHRGTGHSSGGDRRPQELDDGIGRLTVPYRLRSPSSADPADFLPRSEILVYQDAFNLIDKDGDGRISMDNLGAVMRAMGEIVTDQLLQDMINEVDADGTGKLDFAEFVSVFTKYQHIDREQELQKAFKVFDSDADGFITIDELKRVLLNLGEHLGEEEINEMIAEVDNDGDGKISYAEFKQMMTENEDTSNNVRN